MTFNYKPEVLKGPKTQNVKLFINVSETKLHLKMHLPKNSGSFDMFQAVYKFINNGCIRTNFFYWKLLIDSNTKISPNQNQKYID